MNIDRKSPQAAETETPSHPNSIEEAVMRTTRIRTLNDAFRETGRGGTIIITEGVLGLGYEWLATIIRAVIGFDAFTPENDPYGEHDCAVLTINGVGVIWKIDCFDQDLRGYSSEPADPAVTWRVLTVMLAGEY